MNEGAQINFKSGNSVVVKITSYKNFINEFMASVQLKNKYLQFGGSIFDIESIESIIKAEA